ncbi:MAG: hypothetical protein JWN03_8443 [Nocardia sp.]|nr:hypothetical protein [Nocardia sp.]
MVYNLGEPARAWPRRGNDTKEVTLPLAQRIERPAFGSSVLVAQHTSPGQPADDGSRTCRRNGSQGRIRSRGDTSRQEQSVPGLTRTTTPSLLKPRTVRTTTEDPTCCRSRPPYRQIEGADFPWPARVSVVSIDQAQSATADCEMCLLPNRRCRSPHKAKAVLSQRKFCLRHPNHGANLGSPGRGRSMSSTAKKSVSD